MDDLRPIRGVLYAVLFSLPLWAAIAAIIWIIWQVTR